MSTGNFTGNESTGRPLLIIYFEPSLGACGAQLAIGAVARIWPHLPTTTFVTVAVGPTVAYDGPVFACPYEFSRVAWAAFARRNDREPEMALAVRRFAASPKLEGELVGLVLASDARGDDVRDEDVDPMLRAIHALGKNKRLRVAILGSDKGPDRNWIDSIFSDIIKGLKAVEARSADLSFMAEALRG